MPKKGTYLALSVAHELLKSSAISDFRFQVYFLDKRCRGHVPYPCFCILKFVFEKHYVIFFPRKFNLTELVIVYAIHLEVLLKSFHKQLKLVLVTAQFVIVSLSGWGLLFLGGYKFFTKGKGKEEVFYLLMLR